jgi:hypothetical protein
MTANKIISTKVHPDHGTPVLAGEERRRTQRVIVRVPVTLETSMSGQVVKASAHTVAVNVHGAMLLCKRPFDLQTKIEILNERTRERATAHVSRTPRESPEGYLIPLEFEKPFPTFWQISFPPTDWKPTDE